MMLLSFQTHAKSVLKFRLWWWVESHMHFKGSITTLDHRLSQMSGEMGYAYICKRFLFYLSDLVISRRKIWEKPSLDSQIKRDLRVWVLWQGLYSQWERSTISRSLSLTYTVLSFSPSFFSHWKTILWKSCKKSIFYIFFWPLPMLKLLKMRRQRRAWSESFENYCLGCIRFNQKPIENTRHHPINFTMQGSRPQVK